MHACGRCGGVWLDNENTRIALNGLSPMAKEMVARVTTSATSEVDKTNMISCPSCGKPLDRVDRLGITLDICGDHGTWFDRTELHRLVEAMAPPAPLPIFAGEAIYPQTGVSGRAIWGFVCSFFCGLLGLGLSFSALKQIDRSGGTLKGRGFAVAGIIISVLNILVGIVMRLMRLIG